MVSVKVTFPGAKFLAVFFSVMVLKGLFVLSPQFLFVCLFFFLPDIMAAIFMPRVRTLREFNAIFMHKSIQVFSFVWDTRMAASLQK